jgi:hypothetical protein
MPVRVRYDLSAAVSSTSAEDRDLGNVDFEVVTDTLNQGGTWKTRLPASTPQTQYPLDSIPAASLLIIRTNAVDPNQTPVPITVQLNSPSATPITVAPLGDAQEGHMLLSTMGITALYLTNTGGVDMEVTIVTAGP